MREDSGSTANGGILPAKKIVRSGWLSWTQSLREAPALTREAPSLGSRADGHSNPRNTVCLFESTNTIKGDAQTAGTLGAASSPLCMRSGRIHVEPSFVSSFVFFLAIVRLTDGATIFPRQSRTPAKAAR